MKIRVELKAYLEEYAPGGSPVFDYELPEGSATRDLIASLRMPPEMATVIIVGKTVVGMAHLLSDGDSVTVIPPLAGG